VNVLVALDDTENALHVVRHVASMRGSDQPMDVTLFHVIGTPPALSEHGGSESGRKEQQIEQKLDRQNDDWRRKAARRIETTLFNPARRILEAAGACVHTKVYDEPQVDAGHQIAVEAKEGSYDAVVVGRRGQSKIGKFLFGSVTSKVLEEVHETPVWIVP